MNIVAEDPMREVVEACNRSNQQINQQLRQMGLRPNSYEALSGNVKLRNPWGTHPEPDGIVTLPLATFVAAFDGITTASR